MVEIVSGIIRVKVGCRLNVTNKFKVERRLLIRLASVMFRGTPCIIWLYNNCMYNINTFGNRTFFWNATDILFAKMWLLKLSNYWLSFRFWCIFFRHENHNYVSQKIIKKHFYSFIYTCFKSKMMKYLHKKWLYGCKRLYKYNEDEFCFQFYLYQAFKQHGYTKALKQRENNL